MLSLHLCFAAMVSKWLNDTPTHRLKRNHDFAKTHFQQSNYLIGLQGGKNPWNISSCFTLIGIFSDCHVADIRSLRLWQIIAKHYNILCTWQFLLHLRTICSFSIQFDTNMHKTIYNSPLYRTNVRTKYEYFYVTELTSTKTQKSRRTCTQTCDSHFMWCWKKKTVCR